MNTAAPVRSLFICGQTEACDRWLAQGLLTERALHCHHWPLCWGIAPWPNTAVGLNALGSLLALSPAYLPIWSSGNLGAEFMRFLGKLNEAVDVKTPCFVRHSTAGGQLTAS